MTAPEFVAALEARGVTLSREGDELQIDAPKGVITENIKRALIEQKDAILRVLCAREAESEGEAAYSEEYSAQNTSAPENLQNRTSRTTRPDYLAPNNSGLTPSPEAVAGLGTVCAYLMLIAPDDAIAAVEEAWKAALALRMPKCGEADGVRLPSGSRYGQWTITPANSLLHALSACCRMEREKGAQWIEIPEAQHHVGTVLAIAAWWRVRAGGSPLTAFDLPWQSRLYSGEPEKTETGEAGDIDGDPFAEEEAPPVPT